MNMTFHESYGNLPVNILSLVKRFNVSPADFDMMLDLLGFEGIVDGVHDAKTAWQAIGQHIVSNSETGMYRPRFF